MLHQLVVNPAHQFVEVLIGLPINLRPVNRRENVAKAQEIERLARAVIPKRALRWMHKGQDLRYRGSAKTLHRLAKVVVAGCHCSFSPQQVSQTVQKLWETVITDQLLHE